LLENERGRGPRKEILSIGWGYKTPSTKFWFGVIRLGYLLYTIIIFYNPLILLMWSIILYMVHHTLYRSRTGPVYGP